MSKIHPAATENRHQDRDRDRGASKERVHHHHHHHHHHQVEDADHDVNPSMLTVWKRSSMTFQGTDGFTVFNRNGLLAFRVDNYSRTNCCVRKGLVLMDGAGQALFTLKPQILSLQDQWNAYRGDHGCAKSPKSSRVFAMKNTRSGLLGRGNKSESTAEVFMGSESTSCEPDFRVEGCFQKRNCKIRSRNGQLVAYVARKRVNNTITLEEDVFSLVVQPGFELDLIMSFVIVLDRISGKSFTPFLCS